MTGEVTACTTVPARATVITLPDGAQLFVRVDEGNPEAPPMVFLHGNRDNHTHFVELAALLSGERRCASVDLRGHGLSSKEDVPLSAQQCSDDLVAVLDKLSWQRAVLVGHSLGSVAAMLFALDHPDRVSSLVLMGSAAHYEMKWQRPPVTEDTYREVIAQSNERAGPFFFLPQYPKVAARVIASWSWVPFSVHRNLIKLRHPDLRERIAGITARTLVIAGDQDRSTPVSGAELLVERIPDAQLLVISDAGHFMFLEHPVEVALSIRDWLSSTIE
ncbi:alpha/beta hydrolase [Amycolatopsis sp. NBC_00348]|uniref:alpha/beta fold hydrolase n=1 Tax=Amycolatopsis sp. NBC_00348 TaxID=2975956 RepID=UPI002E25B768